MKRVLFDHNVPGPMRRLLTGCEVTVADELGWANLKNGSLLTVAEQSGFDVLLSSDRTMKYEQNMVERKIGVVSMSDNHWPLVKPYAEAISQAIAHVKPGQIRAVFCGKFTPRKFLKPDPSL